MMASSPPASAVLSRKAAAEQATAPAYGTQDEHSSCKQNGNEELSVRRPQQQTQRPNKNWNGIWNDPKCHVMQGRHHKQHNSGGP